MMSDSQPRRRRILCIDGGGVRGAFPAAFLAELEGNCSRPIGSYFDLIAGTSTGGIIAIALALGHRAAEISDFYERRGPGVFGQRRGLVHDRISRAGRSLRRLFRAKHSPSALRAALCDLLGNARLGDAQTRLVIPAWNPAEPSVHVYKTAHHERLSTDYKESAVDVALATSAAPTYFPRHVTSQGFGLLDGGVWANNPIAVATIEAVGMLGWPREALHILSLGFLQKTYTIPKSAGIGTLRLKAIDLFMDGQSHGAMGMAAILTGHEQNRTKVHRVVCTVSRDKHKMDDSRSIPAFVAFGRSMGQEHWPSLERIFFDQAAGTFTPLHSIHEVNNGS